MYLSTLIKEDLLCVVVLENDFGRDGFAITMDHYTAKKLTIPRCELQTSIQTRYFRVLLHTDMHKMSPDSPIS